MKRGHNSVNSAIGRTAPTSGLLIIKRLIAFILDLFFCVGSCIIILCVAAAIEPKCANNVFSAICVLLLLTAFCCKDILRPSLGKRIMKLAIKNATGASDKAPIWKLIVRNLLPGLPPADIVMLDSTDGTQRLADKCLGLVVSENGKSAPTLPEGSHMKKKYVVILIICLTCALIPLLCCASCIINGSIVKNAIEDLPALCERLEKNGISASIIGYDDLSEPPTMVRHHTPEQILVLTDSDGIRCYFFAETGEYSDYCVLDLPPIYEPEMTEEMANAPNLLRGDYDEGYRPSFSVQFLSYSVKRTEVKVYIKSFARYPTTTQITYRNGDFDYFISSTDVFQRDRDKLIQACITREKLELYYEKARYFYQLLNDAAE